MIGDPKKFVLGGRSAGGTLAAYVANEHPALINTVVLENAFLDIVNTLIDDSSANVERDRNEWGDPRNRDIFFCTVCLLTLRAYKKSGIPQPFGHGF